MNNIIIILMAFICTIFFINAIFYFFVASWQEKIINYYKAEYGDMIEKQMEKKEPCLVFLRKLKKKIFSVF